jgi:hypothetical protein
MNRNEALQWLVVNLKQWPAVTTPLSRPGKLKCGEWKLIDNEWRVMVLDPTVENPFITRSDWSNSALIRPPVKPFTSIEDAQQHHVKLNYESLALVLDRAYHQASDGKGSERHGQDLPFTEQPMQLIQDLVGEGFALGQAMKKMQESQRLPHDAAIRELLGAINYIAGAIIHKERNHD